MATTTNVQNESHFEPHVIYLVHVGEDSAIANMERDSLEYTFNEETADFETHSQRNIVTSATTTNPMLSFTLARSDSSEALDTLGIRDSAEDGLYVRDTDREIARVEAWHYPGDVDPTADSPSLVDAFTDCRVDIDTATPAEITMDLSITIDINGEVYMDTTSDLAA
jgi:hypothetical protein